MLPTSMGALFPMDPTTPFARALQDPTYVRLIQRLAVMRPEAYAILDDFLDAMPVVPADSH